MPRLFTPAPLINISLRVAMARAIKLATSIKSGKIKCLIVFKVSDPKKSPPSSNLFLELIIILFVPGPVISAPHFSNTLQS